MKARRIVGTALLVTAMAATGCTKAATTNSTGTAGTTGTTGAVTGTTAGGATSGAGTGSASLPVTPSATPTVTVTQPASFGGTCDDLLPVSTINAALGRPVVGQTAFIVGVPEANIGRLAYLNCQYGVVTTTKGKTKTTTSLVEIGVSLYNSPTQAARRLQGTIEDYLSQGAAQAKIVVDGTVGAALIGAGDPTAVAGIGARTVAVSAKTSLLGSHGVVLLTALAKAALDATNGATGGTAGGSVAAPTSSASPAGS